MLGMNPLTLLDLLGHVDFQRGFVVGLAATIVLVFVRQAGWLLVWGVAAIVALAWTGMLRGNPAAPGWGVAAVGVTAIASAAAFRVLLRQVPAWSVGLVFALWVLGVWGTVPDTERAIVTMGTTAAMLPALWPALRIRVGWEGALVAVGCLGFVVITDGAARTSSMVGALGMVGMPVAAAAALEWLRTDRRPSPWWLVAAQVVHVIVSGRIAGQTHQAAVAVTVVILSALVTGAGLAFGVSTRVPRRRKPR